MQTLLKAEGFYNVGYREMAEVIQKISSAPTQELHNLFKQLVFNVAIGNTDDHLKNFMMLFDGYKWVMSPAYDLLPNVGLNREHVLRVGFSNVVSNRQTLVDEAKYFNAGNLQVYNELIDSVVSPVSNWKEVFSNHGVPQKDIDILQKDIDKRLMIISG
jgi:serine/threonine-protein kinase HipA